MNFRDFQDEAKRTDRAGNDDLRSLMIPLLGLASETGSLLAEYKKWLREGDKYKLFTDQVSEELGDILWYVANIASKSNLDLEEIAQENIAKLEERWGNSKAGTETFFSSYDATFPTTQQLPEAVRVEFHERREADGVKLELIYNGVRLGNVLTDNAHIDDGYRYHDVFHLTNAVLLRWSPVTRDLMDLKRRAIPQIDEVEDGARAAVTEEAISAVVFGHAKEHSFFESLSSVDYGLLRTVQTMTHPFEVRDKSLREWEQAILSGYSVWRKMRENRGGVFVGSSALRSVSYESL